MKTTAAQCRFIDIVSDAAIWRSEVLPNKLGKIGFRTTPRFYLLILIKI